MEARRIKLEAYNASAMAPEKTGATICILPKDVWLGCIIPALIADDIDSAINLSFVCKRLLVLSEQPLANKLTQCLYEADQPRPDAKAKLVRALKLASRKPFLMFTTPNIKNANGAEQHCALSYASANCDLYTQQAFLKISREFKLQNDWLKAAIAPKMVCHTEVSYTAEIVEEYKEYQLPDQTLLPLFNAYKITKAAAQKSYSEYILYRDLEKLKISQREVRLMTKTSIGLEQSKLPRWIKEELFRPFATWNEENKFENLKPEDIWIAGDVAVSEYQDKETWGKDLAVYRGEDGDPRTNSDILVNETCDIDFSALSRLYKSRKYRQASLIKEVQDEVKSGYFL